MALSLPCVSGYYAQEAEGPLWAAGGSETLCVSHVPPEGAPAAAAHEHAHTEGGLDPDGGDAVCLQVHCHGKSVFVNHCLNIH